IGSIIIKQVPEGTILESTGQEGDWYLIQLTPDELERVSGYVHESMVIIIEGPPKEQEEPEIVEEQAIIKEQKETEKPEEEEKTEEPTTQEPVITPPTQPVVTPPPPSKQPKFLFNLVFSGGGSFISGGDLNDGAQGFADYRSNILAVRAQGKAKPAHLSYILGGEFTLALSSHFSLVHGREGRLLRKILSKIGKGPLLVLDVPCGYGRFSDLLLDKDFTLVSSDLSFHMVKRAREKGKHPHSRFLSGVVADAKQGL
ncbi:unnamed protein product, partial [marine sediment metagenome]